MRKNVCIGAVLVILVSNSLCAGDLEFSVGYQFGVTMDFDTGSQTELSHNVAFGLRYLWFENPQIGFAFDAAIGGLKDFYWEGITYTASDGDLTRFSGLLGVSLCFTLSKQLRLITDVGLSIDSKSLNESTWVGEQSGKYAGHDTLQLTLTDNLSGIALHTGLQYFFTGRIFAELGISVHYNMSQSYEGSLTYKDTKQPWSLPPPPPPEDDREINRYSGDTSPVRVLNMGLPYIAIGITL